MKEPEFPQEFVDNECPKVMQARDYRRRFKLPADPEDDRAFAECAFVNAGLGMKCESCRLHLTRPYLHHEKDAKWLPIIERYYADSKAYAEHLMANPPLTPTEGTPMPSQDMTIYLVFENRDREGNILISLPTTSLEKALAAGGKVAGEHDWARVPDEMLINYKGTGKNLLIAMWRNDTRTASITVRKWQVED